jgi:hypothetical protein
MAFPRISPEAWKNLSDNGGFHNWTCGYCGRDVGGRSGYTNGNGPGGAIFICPACGLPSLVLTSKGTFPSARPGRAIAALPKPIENAYEEARDCMGAKAFTASAMLCRVLLLHVVVDKGNKDAGKLSFQACVKWLVSEGWVGAKDLEWVDKIRVFGNEANHELKQISEEEATQALEYVQHLLRAIYEYRASPPP